MNDFRDLIVWQKSMELVKMVYHLSKGFPKEEVFALTSQIRRAAVSVPSNIAEGYGRSRNDYLHFLRISRGSKNEVETQLQICLMLEYVKREELASAFALCEEIGRMLNSLITSLSS